MIQKNKLVSLKYLLTNGDGTEIDRADENDPFAYIHGNGQIIPGLEKEMEGRKKGDAFNVTIPPAEAYGEENPNLVVSVERDKFPPELELEPGNQFSTDVSGQVQIFTIREVDGDQVVVDGNHPLAGETLTFAVEVLDVRDATQDELEQVNG